MKYSFTFLVPALVAVVNAQSAPDFPVQVDNLLVVDYQNTSTSIEPPGVTLDRDAVLETPVALGLAGATTQSTYILFMVDQDVEATPGQPRVQLLHYFQPNLFGSSEVLSFDAQAENATTAVGATYIPPTPPAGDGPHRYTILLYLQPEGFSVPSQFASIDPPADVNARIGFDMAGFAEASGLGQPLSAVWFQVENKGTASSDSSSSAGASASASATATDSASASAGTAETTATQTQGSSSASGSSTSSASAPASTGNAAGTLDARSGNQKVLLGLSMVLAGSTFWMF